MKNISSHAHKKGSWYVLGVLFKFPISTPDRFIWESTPQARQRSKSKQDNTLGNPCRGSSLKQTSLKHPEEPLCNQVFNKACKHLLWKFLHNNTSQFKMPCSKWKSQKATVLFYWEWPPNLHTLHENVKAIKKCIIQQNNKLPDKLKYNRPGITWKLLLEF